jgi:hypothetical protein
VVSCPMGCGASSSIAPLEAEAEALLQLHDQPHDGEIIEGVLGGSGESIVLRSVGGFHSSILTKEGDGAAVGRCNADGEIMDAKGAVVGLVESRGSKTALAGGARTTVYCSRPRRDRQVVSKSHREVDMYAWAIIECTGRARFFPWWSLGIHHVAADGITFNAKPDMIVERQGPHSGWLVEDATGAHGLGVCGHQRNRWAAAPGVDPVMLAIATREFDSYEAENRPQAPTPA